MSQPRPKPWEVSSGTSAAAAESTGVSTQASTLSSDLNIPTAPERPAALSSDLSNMSNTTPYGTGSSGYGAGTAGYGSSGYGSTGGYGSGYGSGMSGYGSGYGSSYGSGYGSGIGGGYGSRYGLGSLMYGGGLGSYGNYGSGMYGMGGYGGGMYGMGGYGGGMYGNQPGAGGIAEGTQATFHLIESIIGAVGGFAQMLEATYMATHSSFFTMVSLAEQFGNLKNALGSLLGIFALIKFTKKFFYKLTGRNYNHGISAGEFTKFEKNQKRLEENLRRNQLGSPLRISFKPLLLFLAASIGFPYLLSKAIQKLNEQQQQRLQGPGGPGAPGVPGTQQPGMPAPNGVEAPMNLQFAKALYEFNPENPNIEIELKPNELVAILSQKDPLGNDSKWWKVRSRLGKVGYVPLNFLSVIERKAIAPQVEAEAAPVEKK